jgi:hypothetical protein
MRSIALRDDLDAASEIDDRAGSIKFHNLYTLYAVLMFAYATSMRAIRTPYLSFDEVDPIDGFAFISDKDDDAHHKTRQVWIPPIVFSQMEAYADHLQALTSDNPYVLDSASTALRGDDGAQAHNWWEICFFLNAEGKPYEVRPKTLSEHMAPYLELPPNLHRRFMRHALLGPGGIGIRGCSPEVAMRWLGHAFQGEEPSGPYSTLGFPEYRSELEPYLLPILKELGWRLRTSPLC